jgi:hypothetical protein
MSSTFQRTDDRDSGNQPTQAIGAFRRTATFDTGAAKKTLREILQKKIRVWHSTYKYAPIAINEDIRLLKILHGKRGDPLKCMLFPCALPSTEKRSKSRVHKFWALSYWWGEDEVCISCFSCLHIPVSQSYQMDIAMSSQGKLDILY